MHQSLGHARTIEQSRVCWSAITKMVSNTLAAIEACSTEEKGHRIKQIEWRAAGAPARDGAASSPRVPCLEGSVPLHNRPYLLAKPLPGRRHPVKAASREAGSRDARQPLPDGAGLAPWRQAGDCVEDVHSPLGTLISPAPVFYRSPIRCHQHRALCR